MGGVLFDYPRQNLLQFPCGISGSYTIPDSVINIGFEAFYYCTNLTGVTIPASVTSIGQVAFYGCTGLTNLTISNGVTCIGDNAFGDCTSLTDVTIPGSVISIGQVAFSGCTGLTSVTISNGVTCIGNNAFADCTSLTNVTIPGSVTSIGQYAFADCSSLTSLYFTGIAPTADTTVFMNQLASGYDQTTNYYLPGMAGWSDTFGGVPAVLWNPGISTGDASFGVQSNQFGFNITNTANLTVVVEVCIIWPARFGFRFRLSH